MATDQIGCTFPRRGFNRPIPGILIHKVDRWKCEWCLAARVSEKPKRITEGVES